MSGDIRNLQVPTIIREFVPLASLGSPVTHQFLSSIGGFPTGDRKRWPVVGIDGDPGQLLSFDRPINRRLQWRLHLQVLEGVAVMGAPGLRPPHQL